MTGKIWAIMPQSLEDMYREKSAVLQNSALLNSLFAQSRPKESTVQNGIAVINIEGGIYRRKAWYMQGTAHRQIKSEIEQALKNEEVRAIFYNIFSPGGTVAGTQELASYIKEASKIKPSCAFVDGMCCSAAYWLASAAGRIFATESAELGSIGVVLMHTDYSKLNENMGLKYTYITAGSKKSVGASEIPLSEEDKGYLQNQINGIYDIFLQEISQNMGLDINRKLEWADGRVFLGKEAVGLGLVSQLVKTKEEAMNLLLAQTDKSTKEKEMTVPNTSQTSSCEQTQDLQAVSKVGEDLFAVIEAVCGAEKAEKVKALAESGITQSQLQAVCNVFAVKSDEPVTAQKQEEQEVNRQILAALTAATPEAVSGTAGTNAAGFTTEEQQLIERVGNMKK